MGATQNIAIAWYEAGCSTLPIQANGSKKPTREWGILQRTRMTRAEVEHYWRPGESVGVALICGAVSGNLELTELEAGATDSASLDKVHHECYLRGVNGIWDQLIHHGYAEWTPSGGLHLIYRVNDHDIPGNTKLASLPDGKTLAETRGEGGYVIVAPSNGLCHPTGEPWVTVAGTQGVIPTITWAQRQAIHAAITAALDQAPPPPPPPAPRREITIRTGELRPGDDFNIRAQWDEPWFTSEGWRISHVNGAETFWVRPGKDKRDGHSASTGYAGDADRLYVWSTSAGLPTETPLSKFYVYAQFHHGGDMQKAARALRTMGFGSAPAIAPPVPATPQATPSTVADADDDSEIALPVLGGIDLTDLGNGRRMWERYKDRFRYNATSKTWHEWTGSVWQEDEKKNILSVAMDYAGEVRDDVAARLIQALSAGDEGEEKRLKKQLASATAACALGRMEAAIKVFAQQPGITVTANELNQRTELLNLPNGTLNLATGELLPNNPADLITQTFGAELDPDAQCPMFEQFMVDAIPDPAVRAYVQRALGYSLLGRATERAMFMLHGPSGTGKSVMTSVMTRIFGDYGATAPASTFRLKQQEASLDLHMLRNKRFVATSEMPEGASLDEELIKRVTGGDMVTSRGLWERYQDWRPRCVVWIATNFLPKVNSDDNAIWRRAKTIKMPTEFGADGREEIQGYADILIEERNGILNWLLDGLADYQQRGLDEPSVVTQEILAYRTESDTVASFIRDRIDEGALVPSPDETIKSSVFFGMYQRYCQESGGRGLSQRRFAHRLRALGYEPTKIGGIAMWRGLVHNASEGFGLF